MKKPASFDDILATLNSFLEDNPENYGLYKVRSSIYNYVGKHDEAIEDISKVIDIDPDQLDNYLERARYLISARKFDDAIKDYNKVIEAQPNNVSAYNTRGNIFLKQGYYDKAVNDFSKAIEIDPGESTYYASRAKAYKREENYINALNDYSEAIELKPSSYYYYKRAGIYRLQKEYELALEDYSSAIERESEFVDALFNRAEIYAMQKQIVKAIDDYSKVIELDPDYIEIGLAYGRRGILYYESGDYYKAKVDLDKAPELAEEENNPFIYHYWREETAAQIAKIEERNKVIQDLSHSIKNLIATVIDPLENLKQENTVQPHIIQNALRGANLIREIVNAINLSFKGSMEDFIYDALNNQGSDAMSIESIFTESVKHSVSNMFDGKYFSNFMRKYFPKKEQFLSAKSDWSRLSQSTDIQAMIPYLEKHFFTAEIDLQNADQFVIGNEKGSAVKLLIMIQEIILNAVKYSAFIEREKRFLRIRFTGSKDNISIAVENPFDEKVKTKTTGTGHVIISNFAKLLGTEPFITKEEGIYSLNIIFKNFWEERSE